MQIIDKTIISVAEPGSTRVLWVTPTDNDYEELKVFIDGRWKAVGSSDNTAYHKPEDGIPYTDLSQDVQTSLGKADSALQTIKTINGQSLVGSGNIVTTEETVVFDGTPTQGSINGVTSGGVASEIVWDVTARNSNVTFASLSALLSANNLSTLIPTSVRKGGMQIRFVCSSDNKYVQYFLTKNQWSASVGDWEKMNLEDEVDQIDTIVNGKTETEEVTITTDQAGFISVSDGSIQNTSSSWKHTKLVPIDSFVSATGFVNHSSVASIALYSSNNFNSFLGGFANVLTTAVQIVITDLSPYLSQYPSAQYVAFSTDTSRETFVCKYNNTTIVKGLVERVEDIEEEISQIDTESCVKFVEQSLTKSQQAIARGNIGIKDDNKYVHFSLDDCTFWADLIINENNYTSCFQNEKLAKLKEWHDSYGICVTLGCFTTATVNNVQYSITDVPSKFATEFAANKDWLRFSFHGSQVSETFDSSEPSVVKGYYDDFVSSIVTMTGTYDCIDRIARLSSFSGSLNVVRALRDTGCGIVGLLTNDRNVALSAASSYYLSSEENIFMHTHCKMYDSTNYIMFIRTQTRLENADYPPTLLNTLNYANFRPVIEFFWHYSANWLDSYFYTNFLFPYFEYLNANGYKHAFTADVLKA